jgi:hypothetical protein
MEDIELFENYKMLPLEVQKIISEYDDNDENLPRIVRSLLMTLKSRLHLRYYLDAIPYNLKKNYNKMKNTERIIKSNKSCRELEKHGYSCQGVTNKMTINCSF